MRHAAELNGWTRFVAMEDRYSVLRREEERDMIPLCLDQGVGVTLYSPLAKGRAARLWGEQTARSTTDVVARSFDREGADKPVVEAVQTIAEARGIPKAQVVLAWVLSSQSSPAPSSAPPRPSTSTTQ